MRAIRPKVPESVARRKLRGWFDLIRRHAGFAPRLKGRTIPRIELVWLPHYLIGFHAELHGKPSRINVGVNAYSGAFTVYHGDGDTTTLPAEAEQFTPKLSPDEAAVLARKGMQKYVILARGQRNKPTMGDMLDTELFYYPYWVYYYERRPGRIDVRVLDASTGEKPGHKAKLAIIDAFTHAARVTPRPDPSALPGG
ncbi:MAG: hypothetical protein AMXMBFR84_01460 [Candidatus Hydrogenedentota bacterium]